LAGGGKKNYMYVTQKKVGVLKRGRKKAGRERSGSLNIMWKYERGAAGLKKKAGCGH